MTQHPTDVEVALAAAAAGVFRFGGYELGQPGAEAMLNGFFDEVHSRMS